MLASDLDNPEFSGARNPDDMLNVEFYDHAALDKYKYDTTGEKSYKAECPFVRISIPGNKDTVIERPAEGRDAIKWPRQWSFYQMQTGRASNPTDVPGWPLDEWKELVEDEKRLLKHLRFYTVEQVAGASQAQIQGMGMGGQGLVQRAKKAISERNGAKVNEEVARRDAEIADLREKLDRVLAMVEPPEPRKPGRPAKAEAAHG